MIRWQVLWFSVVKDKELAEKVKDKDVPYWTAGDHRKYSTEILKRNLILQLEE